MHWLNAPLSSRLTGVNPLMVPSMLVGASSCAYSWYYVESEGRRYELNSLAN